MSFTYEDPALFPRDAVRFAVGDTDARRPQLQDAEIAYCLALSDGNVAVAAVRACEAIITQLGRLCDQSVGSVSKSFSQLQAHYKDTLAMLRRSTSLSGGIPFVGGISRRNNALPYTDGDYVRPQFTRRMMHARRGGLGVLPDSRNEAGPEEN